MSEIADLRKACLDLDSALDAFLKDMSMRARMNGDVDDDGTVILPVGVGVLYRLGCAREAVGNQLARQISGKEPRP